MTVYIGTLVLTLLLGLFMRPNSDPAGRKRYMIIVFGVIILLSALRKYTVGKDVAAHYYNTFLRVRNLPWPLAIASTSYEKGFVAFLKVIGFFFSNPQWMIALNSLFIYAVIAWFIYKHSEDVVMSTFLFIACNTWFMEMNIIRQGMAASVGLISAQILLKKDMKTNRYVLYVLLIALAASFHSAAVILLILPVFKQLKFERKHIVGSVLVLSSAFFLYSYVYRFVSGIVSITRDYAEYYADKNYGTGSINSFAVYELMVPLVCFLLASWTMVYRQSKDAKAKADLAYEETSMFSSSFLMYMVLCLVLCRLLRFRIYIITRMAYYFIPYLWLLYPRAIRHMRGVRNRRLVRFLLYGLLSVIFVYVGYKNAASYYGTVPYRFLWE